MNDNDAILERMRGMAPIPSKPETDADPHNPNVAVSNDNPKGWCDCSWSLADGARCTTCGYRIQDAEFAGSNPFDVLTKNGKECNARKARAALRVVN